MFDKMAGKFRRCLETQHFAGLLVSTEISTGWGGRPSPKLHSPETLLFPKKEASLASNSEVTPQPQLAVL
jgi:hypothetical protein